jgi:hypothetical protein
MSENLRDKIADPSVGDIFCEDFELRPLEINGVEQPRNERLIGFYSKDNKILTYLPFDKEVLSRCGFPHSYPSICSCLGYGLNENGFVVGKFDTAYGKSNAIKNYRDRIYWWRHAATGAY